MRTLPKETLHALCRRFSIAPEDLVFLGGGREDSDGVAYRVGDMVFKVVDVAPEDKEALHKVEQRADFFAYLGRNGLRCVAPAPNAAGKLVEESVSEAGRFFAYQYPFVQGKHPDFDHFDTLTDDLFIEYGRLLGKAHRLAKGYPLWNGEPIEGQPVYRNFHWRTELTMFRYMVRDERVKAAWTALEERILALGESRDILGFVHNDTHMYNVVYDEKGFALLDFDVATCHFFASDFAIALQSVIFPVSGGFDRPVTNRAALERFAAKLYEGYCQENTLPQAAWDSVPLFLNYRRALLYTVMQDWLETQPETAEVWKGLLCRSLGL